LSRAIFKHPGLWAIEEAGLHCPEDIAIVGFDDIELASHLRLTTMRQPMFDMGVLAARKLEERINGSQLPPANNPFVPELIIRDTCGMKKTFSPVEDLVHSKV